VRIQVELTDESLDKLAEVMISKLRESGIIATPKPWLTLPEAIKESGLRESEIRKRIKAGTVLKHQPNPGRPPMLINRDSLLRSMQPVAEALVPVMRNES
jgi:hypothetical protein